MLCLWSCSMGQTWLPVWCLPSFGRNSLLYDDHSYLTIHHTPKIESVLCCRFHRVTDFVCLPQVACLSQSCARGISTAQTVSAHTYTRTLTISLKTCQRWNHQEEYIYIFFHLCVRLSPSLTCPLLASFTPPEAPPPALAVTMATLTSPWGRLPHSRCVLIQRWVTHTHERPRTLLRTSRRIRHLAPPLQRSPGCSPSSLVGFWRHLDQQAEFFCALCGIHTPASELFKSSAFNRDQQ